MGVNKVILLGNVGRNPETKTLDSGTKLTRFTVATTDRRRKDESGEARTEWHTVIAWAKLAEIIDEYVKVGMTVYIEGRIQTRKVETEDGTKYFTEIVADQLEMVSRKDATSPSDSAQPERQVTLQAEVEDDDAPF
jgi:single-strand DNA-binding protein